MIELNNRSIYLGIIIIGSTISAILFNDEQVSNAYLTLYLTVYLVTSMRFLLEKQFYRQHNAILASLQFILLPFAVLFTGMLISYHVDVSLIFRANVSILLIPSFVLFVNVISLTLIPQLIILHRIFYYYHSGRWSGFAIRRKLFKSRKIPYFIQSILSTVMIYLGHIRGIFDGIATIFILIWFVHSLKYYLIPSIKDRKSTNYVNNLLNHSNSRSKGNFDNLSASNQLSDYLNGDSPRGIKYQPINRSRGEIPVVSRSGTRTVSPSYSTARKLQSTSKKKVRRKKKTKSKLNGSITIDQGTELKTVRETTIINGDIAKILPLGKIDKADLSCMFCYEKFHASDLNIVLCPHCKYPAHINEYTSWIQISNLCGRCSKIIPKSEQTSPKFQFKAKDYVSKVIAKL